ncbi:MAG: oligosaccharide flippase family protein [Alteromonadaceae bacterium]|nr:oligosaccharide flippase family protein [Alteromonadaceae bacterium]
MSDKVVRLFASFLVGVFVARYLGPENYGIVAYATSMTALFAMFNHLGIDIYSIKYIVENPSKNKQAVSTVFILKMAASILAVLLMLLFAILTSQNDRDLMLLLMVFSIAILFHPTIIFDLYFQAKVQSKYASASKTISIVCASIFRVLIILLALSPIWFGFAFVVEALILALVLFYFYKTNSSKHNLFTHFDKSLASKMIRAGWMVMLGAIFATIYKRIDQAMLMWLVGEGEVGLYAVAAQLSDVWVFVPTAIAAGLFPKLIELKKKSNEVYLQRLQNVFDLLFLLGFGLSIATTFVAEPLILGFYGEAYAGAAPILINHIWSSVFVFMRALFGRWIQIEQVYVFSMVTHRLGAIANVVINYFVIPEYGAIGAAYATLISYSMAAYFSLIVTKKTRIIFVMMTKSLFSIFRIRHIYSSLNR